MSTAVTNTGISRSPPSSLQRSTALDVPPPESSSCLPLGMQTVLSVPLLFLEYFNYWLTSAFSRSCIQEIYLNAYSSLNPSDLLKSETPCFSHLPLISWSQLVHSLMSSPPPSLSTKGSGSPQLLFTMSHVSSSLSPFTQVSELGWVIDPWDPLCSDPGTDALSAFSAFGSHTVFPPRCCHPDQHLKILQNQVWKKALLLPCP